MITTIQELHEFVKTLSNDLPFYINNWLCDLGHVAIIEDRRYLNGRIIPTRTLVLTLEDERQLDDTRSLHTFKWTLPLEGDGPARCNFAVHHLADNAIYQKAEALYTAFYDAFINNPKPPKENVLTLEKLKAWLNNAKSTQKEK